MTRKKAKRAAQVEEYRHSHEKRKNNPPAKIAAEGTVPPVPKAQYSYSPRRPPELQFDPEGEYTALLEKARRQQLSDSEVAQLQQALAAREPWLEWAGKREDHDRGSFSVDPVALHIHERVSAQAILRAAARKEVERSLFADPEHEYHQAVQFYRHDIDWTNRLILGDSLQVMSSLAHRENLAGKVQMIYLDPPYGIKFASNFQPEVGRRDVKERDQDLTREPEMVKAYRDTWHLGIHSYLAYLRDRLIVARELLADTGSIFVQIGDENLHRVRNVMDEVFGSENAISTITIRKTTSEGRLYIGSTADYLLWYALNPKVTTYNSVYVPRSDESEGRYNQALLETGHVQAHSVSNVELQVQNNWPFIFRMDNITSSRPAGDGDVRQFTHAGIECTPGSGTFKTDLTGLQRLSLSERLQLSSAGKLNYRRGKLDFGIAPVANLWTDISGAVQSRSDPKVYVVQTSTSVIQRCMLMTTQPGDLVLDPTCGSGTTAYVAEQWGRRWITTDTSRVAIAIARQRLLTAKFDMYRVKSPEQRVAQPDKPADRNACVDPHPGFAYRTVPHITLGSIARNQNLDPIFAAWEPVLAEKLVACNKALGQVSEELRTAQEAKLLRKRRTAGVRAVTDADRRRWQLPAADAGWQQWEVPFDTDPDWPQTLRQAVTEFRTAWRGKMDEVNKCIEANAEQEELVDQPQVEKGVVRVTGPFTVEAVQPPELSLGDVTHEGAGLFDGEPEQLDATFMQVRPVESFAETQNVTAYLDQMIRLMRMDGVRFPDNREMKFSRLEAIYTDAGAAGLHAEGRWHAAEIADEDPEGPATVAVVIGPQYGPVTSKQVVETIPAAFRRGYGSLLFAGFSFDAGASSEIEHQANPRIKLHLATIRPDINPGMDGLLKEQPGSHLFTVFGQPRTHVTGPAADGSFQVTMEGVDIYDPVKNVIQPTRADKVAAWFLDSDFDGRTFCITQAFFPDRTAWKKLARALKDVVDEDAFESFSGTESLPFQPGEHRRVAVKVIDPRGNEVMQVHELAE